MAKKEYLEKMQNIFCSNARCPGAMITGVMTQLRLLKDEAAKDKRQKVAKLLHFWLG